MSRKLEVQIVALDRFSKVLLQMRNEASQALRPMVNTGRQVAHIGRLMGLPVMARGMRAVAQQAGVFATNLGLATGSMSALMSGSVLGGARAGPIGAVLALAAAVTALTVRWAGMTFSMNRTASTYGLHAEGFQRIRGAAGLMKIPVTEADQAMSSFAQTLRLIDIGDPAGNVARGVLDKYGIPMRKRGDGSTDVEGMLLDFSRAIQRTSNPLTQLAATDVFGASGLLPLLKLGPDRIGALGDQAAASNVVQNKDQIKAAEDLTGALQRLYTAVDGLANRIAGWAAPGTTKAVDFAAKTLRGDLTWDDVRKRYEENSKERAAALRSIFGQSAPPDTSPSPVKPSIYASGEEWARYRAFQRGERAPRVLNLSTAEGQAEVLDDVLRNKSTTYSSDAVRQQMQAIVNVIVSAPPGATVRATSDSPNVPVRVSRPMPTGNMP